MRISKYTKHISNKQFTHIVERNAVKNLLNAQDGPHLVEQLMDIWHDTFEDDDSVDHIIAIPRLVRGSNWFELHNDTRIFVAYHEAYLPPTAFCNKYERVILLGSYNWNSEPCTIEGIPSCLLTSIFSHLSGVTLLQSCQFVNKRWRATVVGFHTFWNKRLGQFKCSKLYFSNLQLPNDTPFMTVRRHTLCNWKRFEMTSFGIPSVKFLLTARKLLKKWTTGYTKWKKCWACLELTAETFCIRKEGNNFSYLYNVANTLEWNDEDETDVDTNMALFHIWAPTVRKLLE